MNCGWNKPSLHSLIGAIVIIVVIPCTEVLSNALSDPMNLLESDPFSNYFDLGYDLDEQSLFAPGQRFNYKLFRDVEQFNVTQPPNPVKFWIAMYSFCMGEHGGTHVDAPYHLNQHGWKIGEIPPNRLMDIPTEIIDVEREVFALPNPQDFRLEVEHILEHERVHGRIPLGAVVLFHFGWGRYWPDHQNYFGIHEDGSNNFPGLTPEASKWLVEERRIVGVGVDGSSADVGNLRDGPPASHIILCGHQVYIIENIANLGKLLEKLRPYHEPHLNPNCDLRLFVTPIKSKGSGGPARVFAHCKSRF